jgi:hypothetical protein
MAEPIDFFSAVGTTEPQISGETAGFGTFQPVGRSGQGVNCVNRSVTQRSDRKA